jgi:hypothetical protein
MGRSNADRVSLPYRANRAPYSGAQRSTRIGCFVKPFLTEVFDFDNPENVKKGLID